MGCFQRSFVLPFLPPPFETLPSPPIRDSWMMMNGIHTPFWEGSRSALFGMPRRQRATVLGFLIFAIKTTIILSPAAGPSAR